MEMVLDVVIDALIDSLKILPFLFITYLIMEFLEHKTQEYSSKIVEKTEYFGPLWGGLIGVFPQCGFSAAASNLYAGRVITLGTLIAIYLSTSDEMIPLFISEQVPLATMAKVLLIKAIIGIVAGFIIDFVVHAYHKAHNKSLNDPIKIGELCEKEHCHCDEDESHGVWGIIKSALVHTFHIFVFVLILTMVLGFVIEFIGKENLSNLLKTNPVASHILSGIIGLIPNCAASVIITELYLENMITLGTMMSGLLVGAGIGLLILFRVNNNKKENINIALLLFVIGTVSGLLIDLLHITI
ncbi:putative manganese transporter [Butyrivibrio proteoclasticus]|uniref:putative manganese transporter n=1 Tax=Butyrivibrio proteoclasticus TaxID=43305 RepID=UPI00068692E3|nr:putative manganese transporter [Butyrivibrio proteoclasticus]